MKFKTSNRYIYSIICYLILFSISTAKSQKIPLPKKSQLIWQDAELTALISYDLHVFDGKRYNQAQNRINPIEDYNIFNPTKLDTDQWVRAVKEMGGKIAILTVTHETGFALYQSDVNAYSMKALKFQDGKGDVVRDFVASCRKYGILPGLYIGIRWNSNFGVFDFMVHNDNSLFAKNRQEHYNKLCEKMTEELMSRYGELAMVWFDGGAHGPELGGPNILPIVEKYQPNIIFYHNTQRADIRWGGSESGKVSYPCWGTYPFPYSHSTNQKEIFKNDFQLLKEGDPEGEYYMPAMSDAPLRGFNGRHEWFWEPGDEDYIQPLENLMDMYYGSVGRNSTLILGLTPDAEGLIPQPDVSRLKEFGMEIKKRFSSALGRVSGKGSKYELKLKSYQMIDHLILMEDIAHGERVREFIIEAKTKNGWQLISKGSSVGHKFIAKFDQLEVSALRLNISKSLADPIIKDFSVYNSSSNP
jgi:alpha-L-fucosidase